MTTIEKIGERMAEILRKFPQGLGAGELVEELANDDEISIAKNTLHTRYKKAAVGNSNVEQREDRKYYRKNSGGASKSVKGEPGKKPESIYESPLAEYLKKELGYSKAISCGSNITKGQWKTPDVIGVYQSSKDFTFPDEVVSAEIKDSEAMGDILKGFGQACAYLLFSHKVYLVIPKSSDKDDEFRKRLKAMCHLVGLGLITFKLAKKIKPRASNFNKPELRARKQEPDMVYLSEITKRFSGKLNSEG